MSEVIDSAPVQIVQRQLDALNAHDLDGFCDPCAATVRVLDADGTELLTGIEEFRTWYDAHLAEHPNLKSDLLDRMSVGIWVIDENLVTGFADDSQVHVVTVIEVVNGQIVSMRILR